MTGMRRTCACGQPSQASNARGEIRWTRKPHTWVVVKNRVPFWVPNLGYPKRDHNFDNHPHACNSLRALRQRIQVMDELKKIMLSVLSPKDPFPEFIRPVAPPTRWRSATNRACAMGNDPWSARGHFPIPTAPCATCAMQSNRSTVAWVDPA